MPDQSYILSFQMITNRIVYDYFFNPQFHLLIVSLESGKKKCYHAFQRILHLDKLLHN